MKFHYLSLLILFFCTSAFQAVGDNMIIGTFKFFLKPCPNYAGINIPNAQKVDQELSNRLALIHQKKCSDKCISINEKQYKLDGVSYDRDWGEILTFSNQSSHKFFSKDSSSNWFKMEDREKFVEWRVWNCIYGCRLYLKEGNNSYILTKEDHRERAKKDLYGEIRPYKSFAIDHPTVVTWAWYGSYIAGIIIAWRYFWGSKN